MDDDVELSRSQIEQFRAWLIDDFIRSVTTPRQRLWLDAVKRAESQLAEQYRWRP